MDGALSAHVEKSYLNSGCLFMQRQACCGGFLSKIVNSMIPYYFFRWNTVILSFSLLSLYLSPFPLPEYTCPLSIFLIKTLIPYYFLSIAPQSFYPGNGSSFTFLVSTFTPG